MMELASLLGHERFSDHPARVCAVLAAFLRGYNDATSAKRREDLYDLASTVVDSRTDDAVVRERRADALLDHTMDAWRNRGLRFALPPDLPSCTGYADLQAAGAYVGRLARRDRGLHARTKALVEELVAAERPAVVPDEPAAPAQLAAT
jgi:hypothetical protein